ncbi:SUKH-3 domain-containing protein [Streptomyces sp. NPDC127072]|uniref:SUKH-3 domain-containing protein n=1 Tax=Streptomyces sp. NPDC127072 TaxID=3347129 RepID=UPI003663C84E
MSDVTGTPRFPPGVEAVLRGAGWYPGRRTDIGPWQRSLRGFRLHGAAEEFLREFGGLKVRIGGPGITCARQPFDTDPDLLSDEEELFTYLSDRYRRAFCPAGEYANGEMYLAIDSEGVMYLVMTWVLRLGPVDTALEHLVTGVAGYELDPPDDTA